MLKISICPAVAEDAEAIAALNESCFGAAYPADKVKKELKKLIVSSFDRVLVAVYRGKMIGYIHATIERRTYCAPRVAVCSLAVEKEYRRRGVGSALWQAIEQIAVGSGCEVISAAVTGKSAQVFCAACGCAEQPGRKQFVKTLSKKGLDENNG